MAWVTAAFGPFWGFQEGWWSWLSGVTDNSVYPVLFLTYLDAVVPGVPDSLSYFFSALLGSSFESIVFRQSSCRHHVPKANALALSHFLRKRPLTTPYVLR